VWRSARVIGSIFEHPFVRFVIRDIWLWLDLLARRIAARGYFSSIFIDTPEPRIEPIRVSLLASIGSDIRARAFKRRKRRRGRGGGGEGLLPKIIHVASRESRLFIDVSYGARSHVLITLRNGGY